MSVSAAGRVGFMSLCVLALSGCPGGQTPEKTAKAVSQETVGLDKVADAFRSFNEDTGGWPVGHSVWYPTAHQEGASQVPTSVQIDPRQFTGSDSALFQLPQGMKQCSAEAPRPCWNGPYLTGKSLLDPAHLDAWGHARFYLLDRPSDGQGGGTRAAPNGTVVIWSAGPDGTDGFGCSDASCARNWDRIGKGLPSNPSADDVQVVVGTAKHT